MYAASKHAIMGFTDAFRMEVIKSDLPMSVTLIKPSAIDTPFAKHAKNNTDKNATLPVPVYAPELVADQILYAAENPVRDLYVGGGGRAMALLAEHFPTLSDWVISKFMPSQELKDEPADHSNEALHNVGGGSYEESGGGLKGERMVRENSLQGVVSRHPLAVAFGVAAASAAAAYLLLRPEEPESTAQKFKSAVRERAAGPLAQARAAIAQALAEAQKQKDGTYSKFRDTVADYAQEARDAVRGYANSARSTAADYADTARGYAADAHETARGYADDGIGRARSAARNGASTAHEYVDTAKERLHDAADRYVATPAETLATALRRGIDRLPRLIARAVDFVVVDNTPPPTFDSKVGGVAFTTPIRSTWPHFPAGLVSFAACRCTNTRAAPAAISSKSSPRPSTPLPQLVLSASRPKPRVS